MQTRKFGLLGFPLSHSFSKTYFEEKFRKEKIVGNSYENFELPNIQEVKKLLVDAALFGFNVTIPYKKLILPYLNSLDPIASEIGAVNCVKRFDDGWKGYNTDVFGFENALKPYLNPGHEKAIVLGTGGASQAICFVLRKLEIDFLLVSTHEQENAISYFDLSDDTIHSSKLIINTTPLGTYPNIDECPQINYAEITANHLCFDLTYNPEESLFLKNCRLARATISNGRRMLELQAEESWRIWNNKLV